MKKLLLTTICLAALACTSTEAPLVAEDIVITRPVPGVRMGAGYFTLHNRSDGLIRITAVASPQFESVEMHETVVEDGISRMFRLDAVSIQPGQSARFEPSGKHLMIRYPAVIPAQATLQFFTDDALLLSVDARPQD